MESFNIESVEWDLIVQAFDTSSPLPVSIASKDDFAVARRAFGASIGNPTLTLGYVWQGGERVWVVQYDNKKELFQFVRFLDEHYPQYKWDIFSRPTEGWPAAYQITYKEK